MKAIEIIGVIVWLVLMPILGIVGYLKDISWLLYVFGGIITLTELCFLIRAQRCLGSILLILSFDEPEGRVPVSRKKSQS